MKRSAASAFGRYLRRVRERRGLSLHDIERLAWVAGHRIDKGGLSRVERGRQGLALPALSPIGRICGVPAEVLLERFELDQDAEIRGPDEARTADPAELSRLGGRALFQKSRKVEAYAHFRDALDALLDGQILSGTRVDSDRARVAARINVATIARSLGKNHYALHELLDLQATEKLDDSLSAIVLDRMANSYRCLGFCDRSEGCLEQAVAAADSSGDAGARAFVFYSWGALAQARGDSQRSLALLDRAVLEKRRAREQNGPASANPIFEIEVLLKMADVHCRGGALELSGRLALAARRFSRACSYACGLGYADVQIGEIHERTGRRDRALECFERAADIARATVNRRLEFIAAFLQSREALRSANRTRAQTARRKLERLAPWCPDHLPEVAEFHELERRWGPSTAPRAESSDGCQHGTAHDGEGEGESV